MNMVQQSFIEWLHNQRNHVRLDNYVVYDGYYNGDHEVDIPAKVKAALDSELGTVSNYCKMVVDAAVDYVTGGDIGLEVKGEDDTEDAEKLLYRVWENNHLLDEEMIKAVTLQGKKGDAFLKIFTEVDSADDPVDSIKIRVLRPELVFPAYSSDDYLELQHVAIKFYDELAGMWKAQVFYPDEVHYYELKGKDDTEATVWELVKTEKNILGFIPIIHIKNTIDDLEFGVSDLQVMTPLQDALNKTITDLLLTMDNTAFQRVGAFGVQVEKGKPLNLAPGSVLWGQDTEGHIDIIPAGNMEPFIVTLKEIQQEIAVVTGTPQMAFQSISGSGPVSGYALKIHYLPLERKCSKKIAILRNRFRELNNMIFKVAKILEIGDYTKLQTDVRFTGGLPVDDTAEIAVQEKELLLRIKSRRTIMQERGIEDVDAELTLIKEDENDTYETATRARRETSQTRKELDNFIQEEEG